jgi:hypothetical protein
MASNNEIKFIFTGDTSDYDKSVNDVVSKTNKIKSVEDKINAGRKTSLKLQKLLVEEYKDAAKSGGSVKDIEEKIKKVQKERLDITKQLGKANLSIEKRQGLILSGAKADARLKGFKTAKFGAGKKAVGDVGGQAASIMGRGGAIFSAMSAGISIPLIAAFATVAAGLAGFAAAIVGTSKAMTEGLALRKEAQKAGKSVEQLQTEKFTEAYGGDPKTIGDALKAFGVIVDDDLNKSLSESSKKIKIVGEQIWTQLIPVFEMLAKAMGQLVGVIGASIAGLQAAVPDAGGILKGALMMLINPAVGGSMIGSSLAGGNASNFWPAYEEYMKSLEDFSKNDFMPESNGRQSSPLTVDSLARIGIFKGARDSELQTLKASLAVQQQIQGNTGRWTEQHIQALINA